MEVFLGWSIWISIEWTKGNFMDIDNISQLKTTCYMPDGSPVPELLNESKAVRLVRLDDDGPADSSLT